MAFHHFYADRNFYMTAVSNAANLTDGIDGLAAGTSAVIAATLGVFAYVSGNTIIADYLNVFYIPNSAELVGFFGLFSRRLYWIFMAQFIPSKGIYG